MSRRKGANSERELAGILTAGLQALGHDIEVRRTPASGGKTKGDLYGLPGYHVEAKRREKIAIHQWMAQAEADAPEGSIPLVIFRRSHEPWSVVLSLDAFIPLISSSWRCVRPDSYPPQQTKTEVYPSGKSEAE